MEYDFKSIEKKWQEKWEKAKIFFVRENSKKKKFYCLEMYPYPSASFLHMGHVRNYTIGDIYARFQRMRGFNVLYPMGYDSFGLPAETAAKKEGIHPKKYTENAIKKIIEYQKALGNSYDWSRVLSSHNPDYYKWNQYFFLKLYEKGLAYRKKAFVNWCENCQSVLANEEAEGGKCWRCEKEVIKKELEQWFFKITEYADRLLEDLDKIEWPERIKIMQRNWIGKSHGTEIIFKISKSKDFDDDQKSKKNKKISDVNDEDWRIFTTRPDTIFGVTFMVISAQHPRIMEIVKKEKRKEVENFIKKCQKARSQKEIETLDKQGIFTGNYAEHPITKEKIPIYVGNFIVADYGSGMVMGVPAHDQRDFEFAKKYKLPIKIVIEDKTKIITIEESLKPEFYKKVENFAKVIKKEGMCYIYTDKVDDVFEIAKNNFAGFPWYIHSEGKIKKIMFHSNKENKIFDWSKEKEIIEAKKFGLKIGIKKEQLDFDEIRGTYEGNGFLINSGGFNGVKSNEARAYITQYLEDNGLGREKIQFKLRDWMISRQRYWGTPIPIIYCEKCGIVPVNEKDLPILLPERVDFNARMNPLLSNKKFVNVECPKCQGKAKRETDTMGGFVDSSWYFLRFCDNKNKKKAFDKKKVNYWMPVDQYIGGAEHAVMHLMYARFFTKVLKDLNLLSVKFDEPFAKLFNQGILLGADGERMSKSKGNVVFQTDISDRYGIDTARLFLVSIASPEKDIVWSDEGIQGSFKFLKKVWDYFNNVKIGKADKRTKSKLNKNIIEVTEDINSFNYNLAIIKIRKFFDSLSEEASKGILENFLKLLHPFCPHITEELWHKLGKKTFLSLEKWPKAGKIDEKILEQEKIAEALIDDINNIMKIIKRKGKSVNKVFVYVLPKEKSAFIENKNLISKKTGFDVKIFAVNEKDKSFYDPKNFAKKAKPGRPAIYIE